MSYKIQIFCEQFQGDGLSELDEFIEEGSYFENVKMEF
jgi:hypothetical protein